MFSCTLGCPQVDCSTTFSLNVLLYFFYNFHLFSIFSSIICSCYSLSSFLFVYFTDPILLFYYCYSYYSPLNWVFFRPYICGIVVARASFETKGNSVLNTEVPHGLERKNKQVREIENTYSFSLYSSLACRDGQSTVPAFQNLSSPRTSPIYMLQAKILILYDSSLAFAP